MAGLLLATAAASAAGRAAATEPADDVGWQLALDGPAPWRVTREIPGLAVSTQNGVAVVTTPLAFPKARDGPGAGLPTHAELRWRSGPVDLDRYHWLVLSIPRATTVAWLRVQGRPLPVAYREGLQVVDLREHGIGGRRPVDFALRVLLNGGELRVDRLSLEATLSAEALRSVLPAPLRVRTRPLRAVPYHGLDALLAREGGFVLEPERAPPQRAAFEDPATHVVVWQLTGGPDSDALVRPSLAHAFARDGSALLVRRGGRTQVIGLGREIDRDVAPGAFPAAIDPSGRSHDVLVAEIERAGSGPPQVRYVRVVPETGAREVLCAGPAPAWLSDGADHFNFASAGRDLVLSSRREPAALWIAPEREGGALRPIALPWPVHALVFAPRAGGGLSWIGLPEGSLAAVRLDPNGGRPSPLAFLPDHGPHRAPWKLSGYDASYLLHDLSALGEASAEPATRLVLPWDEGSPSIDYGFLSEDARWWVGDGAEGPAAGQLLLMSLDEPGTVMPVAFHGASSTDWSRKPYAMLSPDATKVCWASDELGRGRLLCALVQRPPPPPAPEVDRTADGVLQLSWRVNAAPREVARARAYVADASGTLRAVASAELAAGALRVDAPTDASAVRIAWVEHSGLEGALSDATSLDDAPQPMVCEAELADLRPPLRAWLDGRLSGFRGAVVQPARDEEAKADGSLRCTFSVARAGSFRVRARVRGGPLRLGTDGRSLGVLPEPSGALSEDGWAWVSGAPFPLSAGAAVLVAEASGVGTGVDVLVLEPVTAPPAAGDATLLEDGLRRAAVAGASVAATARALDPFSVELDWTASATLASASDLDHYAVYVADRGREPRPANAYVLATARKGPLVDTGLRPDTVYSYRVEARDGRERVLASGAATVRTPSFAGFRWEAGARELIARSDGLLLAGDGGATFARSRPGEAAHLSIEVSVPQAGDHLLWVRHRLRGDRAPQLSLRVDGAPSLPAALHRFVLPGVRIERLNREPGRRVGERWNDDVVEIRRPGGMRANRLALPAGQHRLVLSWDYEGTRPVRPGREGWLEIERITLTTDRAWRPPGYDPRIDFVPEIAGATSASP